MLTRERVIGVHIVARRHRQSNRLTEDPYALESQRCREPTGIGDPRSGLPRCTAANGPLADLQSRSLETTTRTASLTVMSEMVNGSHDLGVNGGLRLVLNFELAGHLSVQRAAHPGWQRYVTAADAGMIAASRRSHLRAFR